MDSELFLRRYRLSLDRNQLPVELHRSATAVNYAAEDTVTGRLVALEMVTTPAIGQELLDQLRAEAAGARLIKHPTIPALHDFGFEKDQLIYVTEFFEGPTAVGWLAGHGPLPTATVLQIALQVVHAIRVTALHDIAHHALHPGNIVFLAAHREGASWPRIKILHWLGVAPIFEDRGDAGLEFAARFASPEQLQTCRVDIASEVYSLGGTMWFLLTGAAPPPRSEDEAALTWSRPQSARRLPREVRHLVARMRSPEPEERPHDPVALAALMEECLARLEGQPKRTSAAVPPKLPPRSRRWGRTGAIGAAFLFLGLIGAVALISRPGASRQVQLEDRRAAPPNPPDPLPPEEGPPLPAAGSSGEAAVEGEVETAARNLTEKLDRAPRPASVADSAASKEPKSSSVRSPATAKLQVKGAKPIPKILVGSSPAELVGTTPEGQWILSFGESGKRIIVSPPAEFR